MIDYPTSSTHFQQKVLMKTHCMIVLPKSSSHNIPPSIQKRKYIIYCSGYII